MLKLLRLVSSDISVLVIGKKEKCVLDLGSWILDLGSWILDVLCWHMCIHTCMHTCNLDLESFVLDLICIIPLDLQIIRLSVAILVWIESLSPIRSVQP